MAGPLTIAAVTSPVSSDPPLAQCRRPLNRHRHSLPLIIITPHHNSSSNSIESPAIPAPSPPTPPTVLRSICAITRILLRLLGMSLQPGRLWSPLWPPTRVNPHPHSYLPVHLVTPRSVPYPSPSTLATGSLSLSLSMDQDGFT